MPSHPSATSKRRGKGKGKAPSRAPQALHVPYHSDDNYNSSDDEIVCTGTSFERPTQEDAAAPEDDYDTHHPVHPSAKLFTSMKFYIVPRRCCENQQYPHPQLGCCGHFGRMILTCGGQVVDSFTEAGEHDGFFLFPDNALQDSRYEGMAVLAATKSLTVYDDWIYQCLLQGRIIAADPFLVYPDKRKPPPLFLERADSPPLPTPPASTPGSATTPTDRCATVSLSPGVSLLSPGLGGLGLDNLSLGHGNEHHPDVEMSKQEEESDELDSSESFIVPPSPKQPDSDQEYFPHDSSSVLIDPSPVPSPEVSMSTSAVSFAEHERESSFGSRDSSPEIPLQTLRLRKIQQRVGQPRPSALPQALPSALPQAPFAAVAPSITAPLPPQVYPGKAVPNPIPKLIKKAPVPQPNLQPETEPELEPEPVAASEPEPVWGPEPVPAPEPFPTTTLQPFLKAPVDSTASATPCSQPPAGQSPTDLAANGGVSADPSPSTSATPPTGTQPLVESPISVLPLRRTWTSKAPSSNYQPRQRPAIHGGARDITQATGPQAPGSSSQRPRPLAFDNNEVPQLRPALRNGGLTPKADGGRTPHAAQPPSWAGGPGGRTPLPTGSGRTPMWAPRDGGRTPVPPPPAGFRLQNGGHTPSPHGDNQGLGGRTPLPQGIRARTPLRPNGGPAPFAANERRGECTARQPRPARPPLANRRHANYDQAHPHYVFSNAGAASGHREHEEGPSNLQYDRDRDPRHFQRPPLGQRRNSSPPRSSFAPHRLHHLPDRVDTRETHEIGQKRRPDAKAESMRKRPRPSL